MREETQLDLRVVGGEERPILSRNESAPNVAAKLAANRDVLEIRVARREAPGGGHRLTQRRMQPPCLWMHVQRQRIDVGTLELGELAVFHEQHRQLMSL